MDKNTAILFVIFPFVGFCLCVNVEIRGNLSDVCICLSFGAIDSVCMDNANFSFDFPTRFNETTCYEFLQNRFSIHKFLSAHNVPITHCNDYFYGTLNHAHGPISKLPGYDSYKSLFLNGLSKDAWFNVKENLSPIDCRQSEVFDFRWENASVCPPQNDFLRLELFCDVEAMKLLTRLFHVPSTFEVRMYLKGLESISVLNYALSLKIEIYFYLESIEELDFGIRFEFTYKNQHGYVFNGEENEPFHAFHFSKASISELHCTGKVMDLFVPRNMSKSIVFEASGGITYTGFRSMKLEPAVFTKPKFLSQVPPSPPRNFTVRLIRQYTGSIEMGFAWVWPKYWHGFPKSYEFVCKAFDVRESYFLEKSCTTCIKNLGSTEQSCWKCLNNDFELRTGTNPKLVSELPWNVYTQKITVWTELFHGRPFRKSAENKKAIFKYNRFLSITGHQPEQAMINDSLVIPGNVTEPTLVTQLDLPFIVLVCAVRGKLVRGEVGEWSSPALLRLNDSISSESSLLAKAYDSHYTKITGKESPSPVTAIKIHFEHSLSNYIGTLLNPTISNRGVALFESSQNGPIFVLDKNISIYTGGSFKIPSTPPRVGCYHWMLNAWYVFRKNEQGYSIAIFDGDTGKLPFDSILWREILTLEQKYEPKVAVCATLHPFLVWSSLDKENIVHVHRLDLIPQSGLPDGVAYEIPSKSICACSNVDRLISEEITLHYEEEQFTEPSVLALCGKNICSYIFSKLISSSIMTFSQSYSPYTLTCMTADMNYVYLVFKEFLYRGRLQGHTSESFVAVIRLSSKTPTVPEILVAKHHYRGGTKLAASSGDPVTHIFSDEYQLYKKKEELKFLDKFSRLQYRIVKLKVIVDPLNLPVPPFQCIHPMIEPKDVDMKMESISSVKIVIRLSWDLSAVCQNVAKPLTRIRIGYRLINSEVSNQELEAMKCSEATDEYCQVVMTEPQRSTVKKIDIGLLLEDRTYFFQIHALTNLSEELEELWYSGKTKQFPAPIRKIFQTKYNPPFTPAKTGAIVGAVGVILLVSLAVLLYVTQKNYYLHRSLARIFARDIKRETKLGEGHFGEVWKATLRGAKKPVVVKIMKESATDREEKEFREEALLLSKLRSDHIVKTVGICLQSRPIMLVLEFMSGGSVDCYLQKSEIQSLVSTSDLFLMILGAVSGCQYLEAEGYIHRDIAARNCLVELISEESRKPKIVKLTDFGLARDANSSYQSRTPEDNMLPIAWTAPEAFLGKFSSKSDVWAFGVLIWEVFSWASTPFGKCSLHRDNHAQCPMKYLSSSEIEELVLVENKNLSHYERPCNSQFSESLLKIMEWCWAVDPEERPFFSQLDKFLKRSSKEAKDFFPAEPPLTAFDGSTCENNVSLRPSGSTVESKLTAAYGGLVASTKETVYAEEARNPHIDLKLCYEPCDTHKELETMEQTQF